MNPRHEAATDRDGGDAADGTTASVNAGGDNSSEPLHMRLLDAGIPVIAPLGMRLMNCVARFPCGIPPPSERKALGAKH